MTTEIACCYHEIALKTAQGEAKKDGPGVEVKKLAGKALRRVLGNKLYTRLRIGTLREHSYLRHVRGVVHVGANTGQERDLYAAFGLRVAWIEPIPEVFERLQSNIASFPKRRAYNYLASDRDGDEYTLNVADNEGASSSIFDFSRTKRCGRR